MKNFSKYLFVLIAFSFQANVNAASVDTINIYSKSMKRSSKCVVILPESYKNNRKRFAVVYLLHGASGNYSNWIKKVPELKKYVDEFQLILVCPDGNYNSWYFDSPMDSSSKYETYISMEVPSFIDSNYHTIAERNFRAITGLSMGGHGGISLAWKHSEFFGAAGSMSGLMDFADYKTRYDLPKILGDTIQNEHFLEYAVVNLIRKIPSYIPVMMIDCGIDDPFIKNNRQLHAELLRLKIPHDYTERNGTHNWDYWSNAVGYQLLFFHKFFSAGLSGNQK